MILYLFRKKMLFILYKKSRLNVRFCTRHGGILRPINRIENGKLV